MVLNHAEWIQLFLLNRFNSPHLFILHIYPVSYSFVGNIRQHVITCMISICHPSSIFQMLFSYFALCFFLLVDSQGHLVLRALGHVLGRGAAVRGSWNHMVLPWASPWAGECWWTCWNWILVEAHCGPSPVCCGNVCRGPGPSGDCGAAMRSDAAKLRVFRRCEGFGSFDPSVLQVLALMYHFTGLPGHSLSDFGGACKRSW